MKRKFDIYLAGAMHGRTVGEVLAERSRAKLFCEFYGLSYYDPAEDEGLQNLPLDHIIDMKPDLHRMAGYVTKDELNLSKCRSILVLTGDRSSSGTGWEMGMSFWKLKIPISIVAPNMVRGKLVNFTTIKVDYISLTTEGAVACLADYLEGVNALSRRSY